jgi:xylulokinase
MGLDEIGRLALTSPPGAEGLVLLPYLDGERTPNLPDATGSLLGLTRTNLTAANIARASVEGMLCGLADAVDALRASGVVPKRLLLVGGAASNAAVQQIAATLFGIEVDVPTPAQYVARGAAWQAAWALADGVRPQWTLPVAQRFEPDLQPQVRENYAAARAQVYG